MMAPRQDEAGAAPADLPRPNIEPFHDDDDDEEIFFPPGSDDEDEGRGRLDGGGAADPRPLDDPAHHQQQQQPQHQQGIPPRQLSPQEMSRFIEIGDKFESLGVDLVRHIVAASISSASPSSPPQQQPPSPDDPPAAVAAAPFPPRVGGGVSFISLLTTDRETLTMRRLVTKALVDKSNSFDVMIRIIPRIPTRSSEFRRIFGAVVDQMVEVVQTRDDGVEEVVAINVTWGKVITAYAFGLRLIKACVDGLRSERPRQPAAPEAGGPPVAATTDFDPREWGSAMGQVMHERMGDWVLSRGGWNDGFYYYFLDRRGLEEIVTKKLLYVFALGVGVALFLKLVRR